MRALLLILSLLIGGLGAAGPLPAAADLPRGGAAQVERARDALALAASTAGNDWLRTLESRRTGGFTPLHLLGRPPGAIDEARGAAAIRRVRRGGPVDLARVLSRLTGPHEPRAPPAALG